MIRNKYECENCKLKFDSPDELSNHQRKFCIDGEYGNVTKLERRLHDLNQKDPKVQLGLNEIKQYLRGEDPGIPNQSLMGDYNLNELRGYFQTGKLNQDDALRRSQFKKDGDLIDQMKDIKKEKHLMRMKKDQDEDDLVALLKDLEQRKELELRAQIEKEEIQRNLKDLDKKQLSALERERKKELEKLSVERENLRLREQAMLDEVKKMEQQLIEQEKFFHKQRENASRDPNQQFATNDIRRKELELARERGEKIVQIKANRDRLEKERNRILEDLDKVKSGNYNGIRRNDAARFAGENMKNLGSIEDFRADKFQSLEPSIKDKLINDTVRVNYLREQQKKIMNEMLPDIDELDILQKEMENRNFINEASNLANEYDGKNTPNKPLYLSTIRQKLENQAAAPSSHHPNGNVRNYQADLPDHIPYGQGKKQMLSNLNDLKDEYLVKGGEDTEFIQKINDLQNFLQYSKELPKKETNQFVVQPGQTPHISQVHIAQQNPPVIIPPGGVAPIPGFPPPMGVPPIGGMPQFPLPIPGPYPQFHDPMLMQMNQMLAQQEQENQKLREALEGIGQTQGNLNDFDGLINQTTQQLEELKTKILPGGLGVVGNDEEEPFPEDFVFRQNEFRCEDLEVEERALMNLAAQEFDALRLISKLPVNSELYRYKMDQYKELSTMRSEIEKVLQEQRLEKIRRDFEKQKYEDERRFKHEKWLEEQKRQILEAKLKNAGRPLGHQTNDFNNDQMMMPQTQQMNTQQRDTNPMQNQQNMFQPPPMTSQSNPRQHAQTPNTGRMQQQEQQNLSYDPTIGFNLMFDYLFNVPREYRQMRLVYSIFLEKKTLSEPRLVDPRQAEADMDQPNYNKVFFNANNLIKHIKQHPQANIIVELQVPDPNKTAGWSSLGWTILNVFDSNYNLNKGKWRLPIYRPSTIVDLDVRDIFKLKPLHNLLLCMRIAVPKDDIYQQQPTARTNPGSYYLPFIHDLQRGPDNQPRPMQNPPSGNQPSNGIPLQRKSTNRNQQIPFSKNMGDQFVNPPLDNNNRDPNYEISGLQLFVHYARNIKNYQKMKVQATLYEGVNIVKQDNYQDCNWATTGVEKSQQMLAPKGSKIEIGLDGQIQIFKPPPQDLSLPRDYGQNIVGQPGLDEYLIPINQDTTWNKDLYNMLWDHGVKDNLYLLLQVFVQLPRSNIPQQNQSTLPYEPMGYTVFQVNNEDGTIRFGTFEQSLFRMPINLFRQDQSQVLPTTVKFSLIQPRVKPLSAKQQLPDRMIDSRGKPHSQQFIPNFEKQYTGSEDFQNGDGIDVYVDWARFLPDNTTFTKVHVRVVDIGLNYPLPGQKGYASLDFSTARNPFFGLKYEVRGQRINPTLMLLVSFETIDRSNNQPCYCGHSYFPLFMDKLTQLPVTDPQVRSYTLHKGFYQMPIYCQFPLMQQPFTYENFIYLERIPTASMLIRVYKAPKGPDGNVLGLDNTQPERWGDSGVLIQAPEYQEGIYNTQYFFNTALENRLFYIRKGRRDPPLTAALDRLIMMANQNPALPDEKKIEIVGSMMELGQNPQMIDMNFFSQYSSEFGFRAGVEAIHNNNQQAFFGVVMSVCPMAEFYDVTRQGPPSDCVAFTTIDMESNTNTIKFIDGQYVFKNLKETPGMCLIFDVKMYQQGKNKFEDFGYSIFPLFEQLQSDQQGQVELFVNSGIFTLPIYQGTIAPDTVNTLKNARNAKDIINGLNSRAKLAPSTLIVKVVDGQRERHFDKGFEIIQPRNKFIPQNQLQKLQYQPLPQAQASKLKRMSQLIPKNETVIQFQQFLADYLNTQYKL